MIFKNKTKAAFALACLAALSIYSLKNLRFATAVPSETENYVVEFEWFGMDAEKIESLVAVPFEERAAKLEGLAAISSVSEYSRCLISLAFEKGKKSAYASVSDAAYELKRSLPQDAQNPKIYALSQESKNAFCAAFDKNSFTYEELQGKLLKALQGLPGASQAILSGGERMEVHMAFDDKIAARHGIFPWDLARKVQESQARFFSENKGGYEEKLCGAADIKAIPDADKCCETREGFQKRDSIARVNGKECLLLSLKSSEESQNMALCKKAAKTLKETLKDKDGWQIVYDNGAEQEAAAKKILLAFFETILALALAVWLMFRSIKKTAIALAFTAADTLFTAGTISALGIPLDGATISGLAISLGLMCDAALYVLDDCETSTWTLAACSLTTIAAILPLFSLDAIVPGAKALSRTCAISIGLSSVLAAVFLPAFVPQSESKNDASQKAKSFLNLYEKTYKKNKKFLNLYYFLYILPAILFAFLPKNLKTVEQSRVICAQVEYNPERRADFIDKDIEALAKKAAKWNGVSFVQSEAKRGRAEIQIILKTAGRKEKVSKLLMEEGKNLQGSLYVPLAPSKRDLVQKMQVALLGDDDFLCKKIAREAAALLQEEAFASFGRGLVCLNFKDDESVFLVRPKKDFLIENALTVQDLAYFLRWNLFGPVAEKIWADGVQKDVRLGNKSLAFENEPRLETVKALSLKSVSIGAFAHIKKEKRASKIFRKDFRRAAWFTIEIQSKNSGKAFKEAKRALKKINLPDGYYFSWPKEYESMDENYAKIFAAFLIAAAAIFLLVAAQSENLKDALCVLATIPISLSAPLLLRALVLCPLTLGDAVGMVFICGLCVNNALYILGELKANAKAGAFTSAKNLFKSVLSSSVTTLVAAVPVMIGGAGAFAKDLAFFMFFGSLASIFAGLVYFPAALEAWGTAAKTKKRPDKSQGVDG